MDMFDHILSSRFIAWIKKKKIISSIIGIIVVLLAGYFGIEI